MSWAYQARQRAQAVQQVLPLPLVEELALLLKFRREGPI